MSQQSKKLTAYTLVNLIAQRNRLQKDKYDVMMADGNDQKVQVVQALFNKSKNSPFPGLNYETLQKSFPTYEPPENEENIESYNDAYMAQVESFIGNNNLVPQQQAGAKIIKTYLPTLYKCKDGIARKAFKIKGKGNTIYVIKKGIIVKANSIKK